MPDEIGPYFILEELGHGGMGIVFRGVHKETGEQAAIKTLYISKQGQFESILREIRALERLNHPGIVKIVNHGEWNGIPWYAMKLYEGLTLRRYCRQHFWNIPKSSARPVFGPEDSSVTDSRALPTQWWTHLLATTVTTGDEDAPEPDSREMQSLTVEVDSKDKPLAAGGKLIEVLTLIRRICHILAFLHGEGIVHRDLKPANIIITKNGDPVIMDFGLMYQFWGEISREDIHASGVAGGTLLYIAPEQIRYEVVDARADLYAFGCIIYEMITGHVPFSAKSAPHLLKAQLSVNPIPPSKLVNGVSNALDELILKLLAKNPRDRISHAEDIASAVIRLGADPKLPAGLPKPREYLYRPGFASRKSLISDFDRCMTQLELSQGCLWLVGGEAGMGKTRFLLELARQARQRKLRVFTGDCLGPDPGSENFIRNTTPLYPLKRMLRSLVEFCQDRGRNETELIFGKRGAVLALYEPSIRELPGQESYPEPAELPLQSARLRLFTFLMQTFAAKSKDRPFILLLDDLHWADDLTLGFLYFALQSGQLPKLPIAMVGSYRIDEVNETLFRIIKSAKINHSKLEKFLQVDVAEMVRDMMALKKPSKVFVPFITRFTEGNPFFVAEYIRAAVSEGIFYRDMNGDWQISEESENLATEEIFEQSLMPMSVRDLVDRRLMALPEQAWRIVQIASVTGRELDVMLLWEIISFSDDILDAMDELIRRQIIEEIVPGRMRFVNDILRNAAYDKIEPVHRQELHGQVATAMEKLHVQEMREYAPQLAYHWEQAGNFAKAADYYLDAGLWAIERAALTEASRFIHSFLSLSPQTTQKTLNARNRLARNVLTIQGRYGEAQQMYLKNLEKPVDDDFWNERIDSLLGLSDLRRIEGDFEAALEDCNQAIQYCEKYDGKKQIGVSYRILGKIKFTQGLMEEAEKYFQLALNIHTEFDDISNKGLTLANMARVVGHYGRIEDALRLYEEALQIHRKNGERYYEGPSLANIAVLHFYQGRIHKALALYRESLVLHREIGDRRSEAATLSNMAGLMCNMNQFDEVEDLFNQALQIQHEINDRTFEGKTRRNMAQFYAELKRYDEAEQLLNQAIDLHKEVKDTIALIRTLRQLAAINSAQGKFADAFIHINEAKKISKRIKHSFSEHFVILLEAKLIRQIRHDYITADALILKSRKFCLKKRNSSLLILLLCEQGHILLARNLDPSEAIKESEDLIKKTGSTASSEHGKALEKLKCAYSAWVAGKKLIAGECPEDLPEALKQI